MLLNSKTRQLIEAYISNPSSSLIVSGQIDGRGEVVDYLTEELLGKDHRNNIVIVDLEDKKTIGVAQVRELKKSLTTKIRAAGVGRVAIVRNADKLTNEAQNALLKLIEEPAAHTALILEVGSPKGLIATIRSRCQIVRVLPVEKHTAREYAGSLGLSDADFNKAFMISAGESAMFSTLINNQETPMIAQIDEAKLFLSKSHFDRLAMQKKYTKSSDISGLISGLLKISEAAMHSSKQPGVEKWSDIIRLVLECRDQLSRNAPAKLVFLKLCVNI